MKEMNIEYDTLGTATSTVVASAEDMLSDVLTISSSIESTLSGDVFDGPISDSLKSGWIVLKSTINRNIGSLNNVRMLNAIAANYSNTDSSVSASISGVSGETL